MDLRIKISVIKTYIFTECDNIKRQTVAYISECGSLITTALMLRRKKMVSRHVE